MRLKRGVERASCDFCHRRKIKCDRPLREAQGHSSCSACSLRQMQCSLDDSDDIRLRRRRRTSIHDEDSVEQSASQLLTRRPAGIGVEDFSNSSVEPTTLDKEATQGPPRGLEQPLPSYLVLNVDDGIPSSVHQTPDFSSVDMPFELSPESVLFLDQIFMSGYEAPLDYPNPQAMMGDDIQPSVETGQAAHHGQEEPPTEVLAGSTLQKPWIGCNLDEATFDAALQAYFNFAAIHLPVIMEDAFWQDYNAGRCSLALVYAIACRGIAFTATSDSWNKQQRLAFRFRESFLETRQSSTGKAAIRLDDLEALAAMVNWAYDESQGSSLHSQLGSLYLTHESLVLATLQSQMHDCNAEDTGSSEFLARSEDRRKLLFWHVYGLDAFHSLDQKTISRIPDGEINDVSRKLSRHDAGSYLDAILDLAIIAREALQALVTVKTKRKGVKSRDVLNIYDRLNRWQKHDCPLHLRRRRDGEGRLMPLATDESSKTKFLQPLHCSILWLLEINCYMQVEDCFSQYGVQNEAPLEAEMTALRVEFEALRAVRDGMEIVQWMKQYSATTDRGTAARDYTLFDLAPSIARDISAGLCFWICERGKSVLRHDSPSATNILPRNRQREAKNGKDQRREDVDDYRKAAKEFRTAVVTATSHSDTKHVLERLDKQIASFEEALAQ
ncbi:hypothetical protein V8C37DRAFT_367372 [Trichoderma ceciliae]